MSHVIRAGLLLGGLGLGLTACGRVPDSPAGFVSTMTPAATSAQTATAGPDLVEQIISTESPRAGGPWILRAANPKESDTPELLLQHSSGGVQAVAPFRSSLAIWRMGSSDAPRTIYTTPNFATVAESVAITDEYVVWVETPVRLESPGARLILLRRASETAEVLAVNSAMGGPSAFQFILEDDRLLFTSGQGGREVLLLRDLKTEAEQTAVANVEGARLRGLAMSWPYLVWRQQQGQGQYVAFRTTLDGAQETTPVTIPDVPLGAEFDSSGTLYLRGRQGVWRLDRALENPEIVWAQPGGEPGATILAHSGQFVAWNVRQEGAVVLFETASGKATTTTRSGTIHVVATDRSMIWQSNPEMATGGPVRNLFFSRLVVR